MCCETGAHYRLNSTNSHLQSCGSRLCDVGVEALDHIAITLGDHAPLNFEGVGQGAVFEGEVFGKQGKALDGFVLRKIRRQAMDFFLDELMHPSAFRNVVSVGEDDTLLTRHCGHGCEIRYDERGDELALVSDNRGVEDERAGL